jgi:hypothetical protein
MGIVNDEDFPPNHPENFAEYKDKGKRPLFRKLSVDEAELLDTIYYKKHLYFGKIKLWNYIRQNYPTFNISVRAIQNWLGEQELYQINKQPKISKATRPTYASKKGYFQMDLLDYSKKPFNNHKYILNVIDIFSRYLYTFPLLNKSADLVKSKILELINRGVHISVLQSDLGTEFNFTLDGVKNIKSASYSPTTQSIVENVNRTIRRLTEKYTQRIDSLNFLSVLPEFVNNYNTTIQKTIGMTPEKANILTEEEEEVLNTRLKGLNSKKFTNKPETNLIVGDSVRLLHTKKQRQIETSKTTYSKKLYKIIQVIVSNPDKFTRTRYKVKNENGTIIKTTYNNSKVLLVRESKAPPQIPPTQNVANEPVIRRHIHETRDLLQAGRFPVRDAVRVVRPPNFETMTTGQ